MKKLLIAILSLSLNYTYASGLCHEQVQKAAFLLDQLNEPSKVIDTMESSFSNYVGFHTKLYKVKVNYKNFVTPTYYGVTVFEFENGQPCTVDTIRSL